MVFPETTLLAFSLAIDSFAVSVSCGALHRKFDWLLIGRAALLFAAVQSIMLLIGYFLAGFFYDYIKEFNSYVAFAVLFFLGIKMLFDALKGDDSPQKQEPQKLVTVKLLLLLALATSIDALGVGLSLRGIVTSIIPLTLQVAGATLLLSAAGSIIGERVGHIFERKFEIAGAAILIIIAFKILFS